MPCHAWLLALLLTIAESALPVLPASHGTVGGWAGAQAPNARPGNVRNQMVMEELDDRPHEPEVRVL